MGRWLRTAAVTGALAGAFLLLLRLRRRGRLWSVWNRRMVDRLLDALARFGV